MEHWLDMLRHSRESGNPEKMISQEVPGLFGKLLTFFDLGLLVHLLRNTPVQKLVNALERDGFLLKRTTQTDAELKKVIPWQPF